VRGLSRPPTLADAVQPRRALLTKQVFSKKQTPHQIDRIREVVH
jgi:hypothetical protein